MRNVFNLGIVFLKKDQNYFRALLPIGVLAALTLVYLTYQSPAMMVMPVIVLTVTMVMTYVVGARRTRGGEMP